MKKRNLKIGLALAIALDTGGQLLWKYSTAKLPENTHVVALVNAALREPWFLGVAAIFICQLLNWLIVLEEADLSYAQPITSLSYITVCGLSSYLFGEHIGPSKLLGIVLILAGVYCISQTSEHPREKKL